MMREAPLKQLATAIVVFLILLAIPLAIRYGNPGARLIQAAKLGQLDRVQALVRAHPDRMNARDSHFNATPLQWAVIGDHTGVVDFLLAQGADVNARDKYNMTALHKAVSFNRQAMAERLLAQGADFKMMGIRYNALGMNPLHLAAEAGYLDLAELLVANGADVNARTTGSNQVSCLHMAAARGRGDMISWLVKHGAEVNARDVRQTTPLHWARVAQQDDMVDLLRLNGGTE